MIKKTDRCWQMICCVVEYTTVKKKTAVRQDDVTYTCVVLLEVKHHPERKPKPIFNIQSEGHKCFFTSTAVLLSWCTHLSKTATKHNVYRQQERSKTNSFFLPFPVNCLAVVLLIHKLFKMTVHFFPPDATISATNTQLNVVVSGKCLGNENHRAVGGGDVFAAL